MGNVTSPEDSPNWKDIAENVATPPVLVCKHCAEGIQFWHCADAGCCWCADCGANLEPTKGKK